MSEKRERLEELARAARGLANTLAPLVEEPALMKAETVYDVIRLCDEAAAMVQSLTMIVAREHARARVVETLAEQRRDALERIVQWADAYLLETAPEPHSQWLAEASASFQKDGKKLSRISEANMRHTIKGAGDIARSAL